MSRFCFKLFSLIFTLCISLSAQSQLYMPLNIKEAYENGTRSYDGRPGKNYWTNHADYKIKASLTPETRELQGSESITYYNESPDTLYQIVLRLYQDFYSLTNPRDWAIDPADINNGVTISSIKVDGQDIDLQAEEPAFLRERTNLIIEPDQLIHPGAVVHLDIDWSFVLPYKTNLRMGTYDSTSFFTAHWYPQIAVYDDIDGWDYFNYSGIHEFYVDCNNYDVEIDVPEGFIVWATGILQNPEEVLNKKYLERYLTARESDEIVHVIEKGGKDITKPGAAAWHFKAENVPDFAFAASDHYLWDLTSALVDSAEKRRVVIGAAYKKQSKDFYEVAEISRESVISLSNEMPAVPFPYPELTVFNGRGGMEFPMMVNDGSMSKWSSTVHVTSHEIAHTYFPFYMGTNERKYAWMDEGWAVMLPFDVQARLADGYDPIKKTINSYLAQAGSEFDIPMIVPSIIYGSNAPRQVYRNAAYNRPGTAYYMLEQLLGRELFLKAMREYIKRWHFKHPIPYDFFFTFNDVCGENLDWFFHPWFFGFGYPDLAVKKAKFNDADLCITIEKKGLLPIPVSLKIVFSDDSEKILEEKADLWKDGKSLYTFKIKIDRDVKEIVLGNDHIPDAVEGNNVFSFTK